VGELAGTGSNRHRDLGSAGELSTLTPMWLAWFMRRAPLVVGSVALLAVLSLGWVSAAPAGTRMFVGAAEDDARNLDPGIAKSRMDMAARASFTSVRMTVLWSPGETMVGGDDVIALDNASRAAEADGVRLMLSIYPSRGRGVPLSSGARGQFASFAAAIARAFPSIQDFIVGNEPNLNLFWMPQFGPSGVDLAARSYELLLAKTYDALKSVSPELNVIGGALASHGQDKRDSARPTHSPTVFIADLGAAYRASGRKKPIMDMFAIHPYLIPSRLPPTFAHPRTTTIGIADYPKLVRVLTNAFVGTAQHGETLPIVYDEFGYQSQIPSWRRGLYTHLASPAARDAITEALQASYYRQAFALAACQSTVAGILIFHVVDERDARAWQSGVYYSNGTPKTSLAPVRQAALATESGSTACAKPKTTDDLEDLVFREASHADPSVLEADFSCTEPCTYALRVVDASTGAVAAETGGNAVGPQALTIPATDLAAGLYQYVLRVFKCGKPGTGQTSFSVPFSVVPPDPQSVPEPPLLAPFPTLVPVEPES
jgi:hypothetical protein